ncbi:hypothetical protein NMY22_g17360 [Coprinellus aureogranulatus]|nr:hypothetical protein NMY22_g17360 [Coprinellus aureogranulatus]
MSAHSPRPATPCKGVHEPIHAANASDSSTTSPPPNSLYIRFHMAEEVPYRRASPSSMHDTLPSTGFPHMDSPLRPLASKVEHLSTPLDAKLGAGYLSHSEEMRGIYMIWAPEVSETDWRVERSAGSGNFAFLRAVTHLEYTFFPVSRPGILRLSFPCFNLDIGEHFFSSASHLGYRRTIVDSLNVRFPLFRCSTSIYAYAGYDRLLALHLRRILSAALICFHIIRVPPSQSRCHPSYASLDL